LQGPNEDQPGPNRRLNDSAVGGEPRKHRRSDACIGRYGADACVGMVVNWASVYVVVARAARRMPRHASAQSGAPRSRRGAYACPSCRHGLPAARAPHHGASASAAPCARDTAGSPPWGASSKQQLRGPSRATGSSSVAVPIGHSSATRSVRGPPPAAGGADDQSHRRAQARRGAAA
jgi:hypothetical protein